MHHFDLSTVAGAACQASLYVPEQTKGLLLCIAPANETDRIGALASTLTSEGWGLLHIGPSTAKSTDTTDATIIDHLTRALAQLDCARNRSLQIVAVAEGAAAVPLANVVLQSHQKGVTPAIGGIVHIEAFGLNDPDLRRRFEEVATDLARLEDLASILAVRRNSAGRREAFTYHTKLQKLGRESHFLALAGDNHPLLGRLGDAQSSLGRETRWLLHPVHSRNPA